MNNSTSLPRRAALVLSTAMMLPALAHAQEFPTKPVRIITPFPVGSGPEGVVRLVADKLSRAWGQPVMVENRPGGNGFIAIAEAFDVCHKDGDVVARRGEPVRSWIGVAEGFLKVVGGAAAHRAVLYSSVPAGSWMGEGSVIKDRPRQYDVLAVGDTRTVHIPRATFRWLMETSFEFNHFIISHLSERLAQFMAMVETDRIENPKVRVARALCGLFNPVLYPHTGSVLSISQQELGELAGISRQRANVAVSELKKTGVLQGQYGAIVVLDLAALKAIASSYPE